MGCNFPISAFQLENGAIVFHERGRVKRSLFLPCGRCAGCRLERSRQWAVRCMHEAKLYDENCFVTLTYDDRHLPVDRSLRYSDYQLFMKRLRKHFAPRRIRFYMCGEYGDVTRRPHYHACLFNVGFADKLYFKREKQGILYTSKLLETLWPLGNSLIGSLTFESAAYVARYCMETITGVGASRHYRLSDPDTGEMHELVHEFGRMSLKPGIGGDWFAKFHRDVYPRDSVVVNGKECKPPRYYDVLYKRMNPDGMEALAEDRVSDARLRWQDNTDERLDVKEFIARKRLSEKSRGKP